MAFQRTLVNSKPERSDEDLKFNWMSDKLRFKVQTNGKAVRVEHQLEDGSWCHGKVDLEDGEYNPETEHLSIPHPIQCDKHPEVHGIIQENIWKEVVEVAGDA